MKRSSPSHLQLAQWNHSQQGLCTHGAHLDQTQPAQEPAALTGTGCAVALSKAVMVEVQLSAAQVMAAERRSTASKALFSAEIAEPATGWQRPLQPTEQRGPGQEFQLPGRSSKTHLRFSAPTNRDLKPPPGVPLAVPPKVFVAKLRLRVRPSMLDRTRTARAPRQYSPSLRVLD